MLAKVLTGAVVGMDGALVEVDIAQSGLPNFLIVDLPDTAVQEARERVAERADGQWDQACRSAASPST